MKIRDSIEEFYLSNLEHGTCNFAFPLCGSVVKKMYLNKKRHLIIYRPLKF